MGILDLLNKQTQKEKAEELLKIEKTTAELKEEIAKLTSKIDEMALSQAILAEKIDTWIAIKEAQKKEREELLEKIRIEASNRTERRGRPKKTEENEIKNSKEEKQTGDSNKTEIISESEETIIPEPIVEKGEDIKEEVAESLKEETLNETSSKKRGRPAKKVVKEEVKPLTPAKKRGRPAKVKEVVKADTPAKKRGRPKKIKYDLAPEAAVMGLDEPLVEEPKMYTKRAEKITIAKDAKIESYSDVLATEEKSH